MIPGGGHSWASNLSFKHACIILIPIWLFWGSLMYLQFSRHRVGVGYDIEFEEPAPNESYLVSMATGFVCEMKSELNAGKIKRIYRSIGAISEGGMAAVVVIPRTNPHVFWRTLRRDKKDGCEAVPDTVGKLRYKVFAF